MRHIKFFVMDVDGTLTDGMIYMSGSGEMFKAFNVKDGCGIKEILPEYGIVPVIITARESDILKKRCEELGIVEVHQGCRDKLGKLKEIIERYSVFEKYTLKNVAYAGDDILDVPCMKAIHAQGGFVIAPHNAIAQVCDLADFVSNYNAGYGAIRESIDYILSKESPFIHFDDYEKRISFALEFLRSIDLTLLEVGRYDVNEYFYYMIKEYPTKYEYDCSFETHKYYTDIQWIIEGTEIIKICGCKNMRRKTVYDDDGDVVFLYDNKDICTEVVLRSGSYIVIPVGVAHKPCIQYEQSENIKKLVGKIKMV